MCGIFGIVSSKAAKDRTIVGLQALEYRGYDSSGISYVHGNEIITSKVLGKVSELKKQVELLKTDGKTTIAHTRWATHGVPSVVNAHPHSNGRVSVVHNGIIENSKELRESLERQGVVFTSDTDTEVVLHLIDRAVRANKNQSLISTLRSVLLALKGSYALLILLADYPNAIIATKNKMPMIIGYGKDENFVSSDVYSLANFATKVAYLEDEDMALVTNSSVEIFTPNSTLVERKIEKLQGAASTIDKGAFAHFMEKEIFQQPQVLKDLTEHYVKKENINIDFSKFKSIKKIYIVACGSSYIAALVAKSFIESLAHISVEVEIASEFFFRKAPLDKNSVGIFISQSGETADTITALNVFKDLGGQTIAMVNAKNSTIARGCELVLPIYAGVEVSVASTKSFSAQVLVLGLLALKLALDGECITKSQYCAYLDSILLLPGRVSNLLDRSSEYFRIAENLTNSNSALYVGRGVSYPVAMEGALKLKELSYIHAEAISSGELKHGPIALIDEKMHVFAIAPHDEVFTKASSNLHAISARKGKLILLSDSSGVEALQSICYATINVGSTNAITSPIIYTIPLQLIAYHVACLKKCNVDQPRNLAKSVTVE